MRWDAESKEEDEDELLLDEVLGAVSANLPGAALDARRRGAFTVGPADPEDCWACISEAVPASRKLNAAARQAIPKKLRLVIIVLATP